ncbi:tyrosine-type recombinase/integrase [Bradyrhizobium pachyrhizi]|uniref:Tyrosine-type recombinase/integrase n=1 Tax=Bradyrhizobium pachyrhizi TaxID=280333 RepID=A0A844SXC2_9BRAD|nr:tyrosine-type recombinase/integrase [Bradyrhizobium pachyrhizi]MVT70656.1 tyrosine-type recombinase/integrase [Bradyrhizobium pachyrhizi]
MTAIRVKGFKIFKDRHGKPRCYHRKTRTPIDLEKCPVGTPEFFAEVARIGSLSSAVGPKPGTLGLLIQEYRKHEAFTDLAPRTKSDYQAIFDYLKPIADTPLVKFTKPLVVRIRDKAAATKGRKFGNDVKARLSTVFGWGSERGFIAGNPASGIKDIRRKKGLPDANRPWADEEREAGLDILPAWMKPALGLMMFTGLGPKDALTLPRNFYRDGEIATRRAKTGEPVFWPCPAPLAAILDDAPEHNALTLVANKKGLPWTLSGFRASWRPYRVKLEKAGRVGPGLTLYGLRHTVAVILREIGHDERTIADALGQKTIEMARHYAKGADLKPKMRGVVRSFDDELNKRKTNTVKPTA